MAHDALRRRSPNTISLDAPAPNSEEGIIWPLAADVPDHVADLLSQELSARVQQALLQLTPDHRIVVVLHHLEGMPVEDIAHIMSKPTGTVKSRLARARAELKSLLAGYVEER
jgi:RNA polymerase sigma-70 factor (ECF subfamily)